MQKRLRKAERADLKKEEILRQLREIVGSDACAEQEPLSRHTTFRIGGPAAYFVCPHTDEEIRQILTLCQKERIPWFVMGNGSNILASDEGFDGVILSIYKSFQQVEVEKNRIRAKAGIMLSALSHAALDAGLAGLEFASGIPGTLGGAVMMNAGAYGGEMKDIVQSVTVMTKDGEILEIPGAQMAFGYRTSIAREKEYIVLSAVLELKEGDREQIASVMQELKKRRVAKQPLEFPSAGSTFKRPEGYFAGKLIMDAGLAGYTVGEAKVSEKHCGFVVNTGHASAADVAELMRQVQDRVEEQFGVRLEPEVRFLGRF